MDIIYKKIIWEYFIYLYIIFLNRYLNCNYLSSKVCSHIPPPSLDQFIWFMFPTWWFWRTHTIPAASIYLYKYALNVPPMLLSIISIAVINTTDVCGHYGEYTTKVIYYTEFTRGIYNFTCNSHRHLL